MKKTLFLLITVIAFGFASCDKKDLPEPIDKGEFDPNATITIRPAKGVQVRATIPGLTATEIVEQALSIKYQSNYINNVYDENKKDFARRFDDDLKDFDEPALKMYAIDVIAEDGSYYRDLTYAVNVVITDAVGDTIAYVPDEVISTARPLIEAAYEDENYTEVYRIFDEAFTFIPVSAE